MQTRALTGTTVGTFDTLSVRSPAVTGDYRNILSLLGSGGGGGYDDTELREAVAINTSQMSLLSMANTSLLGTKRDRNGRMARTCGKR